MQKKTIILKRLAFYTVLSTCGKVKEIMIFKKVFFASSLTQLYLTLSHFLNRPIMQNK